MWASLRRRGLAEAVVLLACGGWNASPAANSRGELVVIQIGEPLAIFGKTYPGGRLALRPLGAESPGVTLHAVSLDGNILGVLPGRLRPHAGEHTEATGHRCDKVHALFAQHVEKWRCLKTQPEADEWTETTPPAQRWREKADAQECDEDSGRRRPDKRRGR